jgi:hypothetical protein
MLGWEPVSPPWLRHDRWLGSLVAWADGFAILEHRRVPDEHESRPRAVWHSSDGRAWIRSPLPRSIAEVHDLLAHRDGLLLVANERRDFRHHGFALGFWRSPDGVQWSRAGGLSYRVPWRLQRLNCQANRQQVTTIGDRITVYVTLCWDPCCGTLPIASRDESTVGPAARVGGAIEARGVAAWSSADGRRWRRLTLEGMAPPGTDDYGITIQNSPNELVALRLAREPAILRSSDGISWTTYGMVPPSLDWYGNLQLAPLPEGLLLVAESSDSPPGFGNAMIGWRMTSADTTRVFARRAAVAEWVLVDGPNVLVGGRSWGKGPDQVVSTNDDEAWAWLIGSTDGGATWLEGSSWTGGDQSCLGDVVRRGDTLVGLACVQDRDWATVIPPGYPAVWIGEPRVNPGSG